MLLPGISVPDWLLGEFVSLGNIDVIEHRLTGRGPRQILICPVGDPTIVRMTTKYVFDGERNGTHVGWQPLREAIQ